MNVHGICVLAYTSPLGELVIGLGPPPLPRVVVLVLAFRLDQDYPVGVEVGPIKCHPTSPRYRGDKALAQRLGRS